MGTSEHHITGIITYTGKDQYSLTVINTGEGVDRHPSLENERNPIYYTRYHLTGIDENKMSEFIKNLKQILEAPSSDIGCEILYDAINDLQGKFDSENSFTDYLQRGGSCAARQELLIAKHMMNQKDYRQLKIFLSQTAVLELADIYTSGTMSNKDKVIFLDCVQRLKKRYIKHGQIEMATVMKDTELNIKISLSEAKEEIEPKMFGMIPQTDQHASDDLKSFVEALRNLQRGDFNGLEQNMKAFQSSTRSIFISKDYPEINLEGNKNCFKMLYKAFLIFAENCTDKNYKNYSKEEIRAISTLTFYFHLFMNDENITLISSDEEELISNKNSYEKYLNRLDKFVELNDPKACF